MRTKLFSLCTCICISISAFWGVSNYGTIQMALTNVEILSDSEGSSNICVSGGKGATACSITAGTTVVGVGLSGGCSVSCDSGYYACCGINCTCERY